VTKYRPRVGDARALDWLANHALYVIDKMPCRLLACNGEANHLHMLVEYPPKHSISVLVNAFNGTSSRLLRKARPDIASRYHDGILWSGLVRGFNRRRHVGRRQNSMSNCSGSALPPRREGRGFRALKNR